MTVAEWFGFMPEVFQESVPSGAPQKIMDADCDNIFQMFAEISDADDRVDAMLSDLGAAGGLYLLARLANAAAKYGDLISDMGELIGKHQAMQSIVESLTVKVGKHLKQTLASDESYVRMLAAATPKPNPMMAMVVVAR